MASHTTTTEETARGALDTLRAVTKTSVTRLAGVLGISRQGVYDKLSGQTPLNLKDIDRLTAFFKIPPKVLFMERAELLTWMGSSGWSDQVADEFRCIFDWPAAA